MSAISIKDLSFSYDKKMILDNLNVVIPEGKITIFVGPNGCGKSTLLKNVARILKPQKGNVTLLGDNIKEMSSKVIARKMAFLPQSPIAPAGLLVNELVSYGRYPYQKPFGGMSKEDCEIVNWAMEKTGVLAFRDRPVDMLSGGQRQRVWIAMALAQKTPVLLLDEPTTYLDIAHQLEILELLRSLNRDHQQTIVVVLHELNLACRYADHMIGMKDGEVVFEGAPSEVINKDNLRNLYGIEVELQKSVNNDYPVCVDYQLC